MCSAADKLADLNDEELARRSRAGSSSCFEELVRRFQVPLLRFLLRRTARRCDAEDILQESFVRAYECLGQYRDAWPFRTWLFTIAHRLAISHGRKVHARDEAELTAEPAGDDEGPAERLGREEEKRGLWEAARTLLTGEQFSAVWLHYVEELPAREIARVLGRTRMAVKTMLHRARKRLLPQLAISMVGQMQRGEV